MKAYKVNKEYKDNYWSVEKDRLFVKLGYDTILLATQTLPTKLVYGNILNGLKEKGYINEVELADETWVHPHLYKPVREIFNKEKLNLVV